VLKRKKRRKAKREKRLEERLNRKNEFGMVDLTPFGAVERIRKTPTAGLQ